jgi:hypothetical protein
VIAASSRSSLAIHQSLGNSPSKVVPREQAPFALSTWTCLVVAARLNLGITMRNDDSGVFSRYLRGYVILRCASQHEVYNKSLHARFRLLSNRDKQLQQPDSKGRLQP